MKKTILGILAILVLLVLFAGGCAVQSFNGLVALSEAVDGSWAQVETALQRRFDLIPNLVETVKGFARQEREVLTEVTRLRSQWSSAAGTRAKIESASALEGAISRLLVVVERYPDLKSNQNFLSLQHELAGTENRIAVERRRYNEAVQRFNTRKRQFPTNIVASLAGFRADQVYFEAESGAEQVPKVKF